MRKVLGSLVAVLAIAGAVNADLVDGGFEATGQPVEWVNQIAGWGSGTYNYDATSGGAHSGSQYLNISTNGGSNAAYQIVTVAPNVQINLSWAVKGTASGGYWTEVGWQQLADGATVADPNDSPINLGVKYSNSGFPAVPANWTTGNIDLTPTGNTIAVFVKCGASGGSNNSSFDSLVLTPEPAAALLLGLPLLFVRRRRA